MPANAPVPYCSAWVATLTLASANGTISPSKNAYSSIGDVISAPLLRSKRFGLRGFVRSIFVTARRAGLIGGYCSIMAHGWLLGASVELEVAVILGVFNGRVVLLAILAVPLADRLTRVP